MAKIEKLQIYDCDGVICDSRARYRTMIRADGKEVIDLDHWREHQHRCMELDKPGPLFDQYQRDLQSDGVYVVVATAREIYEPDRLWLRDVAGMPNYLISRPHGSTIGGADLKINGLKRFFNLKNFRNAVATIHEDNIDYCFNIAKYFGINAVLVQSGQGH